MARSSREIIEDLLEVMWYHEGAMDDHAERISALEAEAREFIADAEPEGGWCSGCGQAGHTDDDPHVKRVRGRTVVSEYEPRAAALRDAHTSPSGACDCGSFGAMDGHAHYCRLRRGF